MPRLDMPNLVNACTCFLGCYYICILCEMKTLKPFQTIQGGMLFCEGCARKYLAFSLLSWLVNTFTLGWVLWLLTHSSWNLLHFNIGSILASLKLSSLAYLVFWGFCLECYVLVLKNIWFYIWWDSLTLLLQMNTLVHIRTFVSICKF